MRCNVMYVTNPCYNPTYLVLDEKDHYIWCSPQDLEITAWATTGTIEKEFFDEDVIELELVDVPEEEAWAYMEMMRLMGRE